MCNKHIQILNYLWDNSKLEDGRPIIKWEKLNTYTYAGQSQ